MPTDAKPPAKPLLRPRNVVLLSAGLLAAWIGLEVFRALTAASGAAVDYGEKILELVEAHQPAGPETPNGWDALLEAIRREDAVNSAYRQVVLPEEGDQAAIIDYTLLYYTPSDESVIKGYEPHGAELVRRKSAMALEEVRRSGAFDKLAEMARTPRAVRPRQTGRLIEWLLPELGECRNFARMNAARMHQAALAGDAPELIAAYEQTLALGRVCAAQHTLIDHLVGIAIVTLANGHVREGLRDRAWDAATIRELMAAMDRQLPLAPLELAMKGERLATMDTIQWMHTDNGRGDGRLIVSELRAFGGMWGSSPELLGFELPDTKLINLAGMLYAGKAATTRKADEFYEGVLEYAKTPAWARGRSGFNPDVFTEGLSYRYALLRMLVPAVGRSVAARTQSDMDIAGTRVVLAIELFRAENGRCPASLDELAPSYLPSVPVDPFSGRPFCYLLREPDAEDPRPYVLYSTGADGVDNGGVPHPNEPHAAMRPTGVGTDFVINQPPEKPEPRKGQ